MNLVAIFLTGLTTGGLSCLAVQGGLLASFIVNQKNKEHDDGSNNFTLKSFDLLDWAPVALFLGTKIISHTILGFMLGALGSVISLSLNVRIAFQVFTAFFMFATAMNLLDIHPVFRYVVLQPPRFLMKMIKNKSRGKAFFTPAILGVMTIFIPCGVTQAMEVVAINSGNPWQGGLIMFSFTLGTVPLFALLGIATAKLSEGWYHAFTQIAAVTLLLMSLYIVNGALIASDSPYAFNLSAQTANTTPTVEITAEGEQEVVIKAETYGYEPSYIRVKKGQPVSLTIQSDETYTCALYFVFREFGIEAFLKPTDTKTFKFIPNKKGKFVYSCSMGMYRGVMEVI